MRALRTPVAAAISASVLVGATAGATSAQADDQISYTSAPDRVAIFLNNVAYARDEVALPGGVDVRIVLPSTVYADTLVLRENGRRVSNYRLNYGTGQPTIKWQSATDSELRDISMEYLLGGVSWRPTYDMWVGADTDETVELDYFAEITDSSLELEDVETQLVAGMVDLNRPIAPAAELSANQRLAGFEAADMLAVSAPVGQVDIQHTYDIGELTAEPGDMVYAQLVGQELPARRLHIWNAPTDQQVTVIYKVKNESDQPFTEGVVRNYQDGLFIGSDFIELTPVGGEGSVTIGHLQDVRVKREQTQQAIDMGRFDYRYEVTLTIENFTPTTVHLDVVDYLPPQAEELQAAIKPQLEAGNVMRWPISVEPGDEMVLTYEYLVD
ncbi:MAG: DUF4139 domain-containing protein [Chloroflexota bacterium]|jgi:hypothetical protein